NHPVIREDSPRALQIRSYLERFNGGNIVVEASWEELRDQTQKHNDAAEEAGQQEWASILLEEVWEALSETDPHQRQQELVQVAAVALNMVDSIQRNEILNDNS